MNELYNRKNICKVIKTGEYKDVKYYITTIGIHPCAYVECEEEFLNVHKDLEWGDIEGIHVHGGVTYAGRMEDLRAFEDEPVLETLGKFCFGWDYGHCDDWAGYLSDEMNESMDNHMWTVSMIEQECQCAIEEYLKMK